MRRRRQHCRSPPPPPPPPPLPRCWARRGQPLLLQAQARLQKPRSNEAIVAVQRMKTEHGFTREVEVALQLLPPKHMEELVAHESDLRRKLADVPDRSKVMLSFIGQVDPEALRLVRGLGIHRASTDPADAAAAAPGPPAASAKTPQPPRAWA